MLGSLSLILTSVFLLGLGGTARQGMTQIRSVDLIELNHYLDHEGREVFRQVIFYDWSPATAQYHVRHWRLVRSDDELPQRVVAGQYECRWTKDGQQRIVLAKRKRETTSHRDPEQTNRRLLPEDKRRPLFD